MQVNTLGGECRHELDESSGTGETKKAQVQEVRDTSGGEKRRGVKTQRWRRTAQDPPQNTFCQHDHSQLPTEATPLSFMIWKSKTSKRTILTTFGVEAIACRDALDLAEYTPAMLCEVVIGRELSPDKMEGGTLANSDDHRL